jgi:hypothetical protein
LQDRVRRSRPRGRDFSERHNVAGILGGGGQIVIT